MLFFKLILQRDLYAFSVPFLMASGTSFALPCPTPKLPFLSPTTTNAEKLNRRPPLTTLAHRLMLTTFSINSEFSAGRGVSSTDFLLPPPLELNELFLLL